MIRRSASERRTTGSGGQVMTMEREISVGDELPDTVEIESFLTRSIPKCRKSAVAGKHRSRSRCLSGRPGRTPCIEVIR